MYESKADLTNRVRGPCNCTKSIDRKLTSSPFETECWIGYSVRSGARYIEVSGIKELCPAFSSSLVVDIPSFGPFITRSAKDGGLLS